MERMIRKTATETLTSISNGGKRDVWRKDSRRRLAGEANCGGTPAPERASKKLPGSGIRKFIRQFVRDVAESLPGSNYAISQCIIRTTTTRTTQQMGVTGNFCACTVMRMNIPEMTSRMHTKTPLRPLQLGKRHRLLGFDHLLGSTHSCGNVNGSKAQGIQIAPPGVRCPR